MWVEKKSKQSTWEVSGILFLPQSEKRRRDERRDKKMKKSQTLSEIKKILR